jgi:hypothetical protein
VHQTLDHLFSHPFSEYKKTVDSALTEVITDGDVQALLLLLLRKDGRHDSPSDDVLAKNDARKLYMVSYTTLRFLPMALSLNEHSVRTYGQGHCCRGLHLYGQVKKYILNLP